MSIDSISEMFKLDKAEFFVCPLPPPNALNAKESLFLSANIGVPSITYNGSFPLIDVIPLI
ncbi:hypothetical protein D3C84_1157610 [compost metagenome]